MKTTSGFPFTNYKNVQRVVVLESPAIVLHRSTYPTEVFVTVGLVSFIREQPLPNQNWYCSTNAHERPRILTKSCCKKSQSAARHISSVDATATALHYKELCTESLLPHAPVRKMIDLVKRGNSGRGDALPYMLYKLNFTQQSQESLAIKFIRK